MKNIYIVPALLVHPDSGHVWHVGVDFENNVYVPGEERGLYEVLDSFAKVDFEVHGSFAEAVEDVMRKYAHLRYAFNLRVMSLMPDGDLLSEKCFVQILGRPNPAWLENESGQIVLRQNIRGETNELWRGYWPDFQNAVRAKKLSWTRYVLFPEELWENAVRAAERWLRQHLLKEIPYSHFDDILYQANLVIDFGRGVDARSHEIIRAAFEQPRNPDEASKFARKVNA